MGPRLSDFAVYRVDSDEPVRGITSKHLQAIKLDVIRQRIADETDGDEVHDPAWTRRVEQITESMRSGRRTRRDDLFYAEVAAVYVDVTKDTKRGIYKEMAGRLPLAESSLSDVVKEARNRGLLTRPIEGRSGGYLTPKAIELIEGKTP